jgi:hypothetical protein
LADAGIRFSGSQPPYGTAKNDWFLPINVETALLKNGRMETVEIEKMKTEIFSSVGIRTRFGMAADGATGRT